MQPPFDAVRLAKLLVQEISGVDDPANLSPGWAVMKAAGKGADERALRAALGEMDAAEALRKDLGDDDKFIAAVEAARDEIERVRKNMCLRAALGSDADETALRGILGDEDFEQMVKGVLAGGAGEMIAKVVKRVQEDENADVETDVELIERAVELSVLTRKSLDGQEDGPGERTSEPAPEEKPKFDFFNRHTGAVHSKLR